MRDIANNIGVVPVVAPAVLSATNTSEPVDLAGFETAALVINTGAIVSAGDFTAKLQESDTTTSGDFTDVAADRLPAVEHRQGALSMMGPIAELERAIIARKLRHGGNPVLRFCFANVEAERNRAGHVIRLVKPKKWLSIDGAVAAAMAVGRAQMNESKRSVYADAAARPTGFVVLED